MGKKLIYEKREIRKELLNKELVGCLFVDYYEMPVMLARLKKYPDGIATEEQLLNEIIKFYDEQLDEAKEFRKKYGNSAIIAVQIGFFDEEDNFHVVSWLYYD